MLETLKFVRAAVDRSGNRPELSHFRIRNGTVQANNGHLAIQAPIACDLECAPHAESLIRALSACEDVISLHVEAGKLVVRSGKFRTFVPLCQVSAFPDFIPSGQRFPIPQPIGPILKKLLPFVATDERRPWACGVRFVNNSAIATNSICLVEHWLPVAFPIIATIPRDAIAELLRLKLEPVSLQASAHAVTFHLPGDAWISSRIMPQEWPDIPAVFAHAEKYAGPYTDAATVETLLNDVAKLETFTDERRAVYFHNGTVATTADGVGTSIDNPNAPASGIFKADQLAALRGVADRVGFGAYPAPVPFFGELLRGVMVGYSQ